MKNKYPKGNIVISIFGGTIFTNKPFQKDYETKKVTVWTKTPKFCIPQGPFLQFCLMINKKTTKTNG